MNPKNVEIRDSSNQSSDTVDFFRPTSFGIFIDTHKKNTNYAEMKYVIETLIIEIEHWV